MQKQRKPSFLKSIFGAKKAVRQTEPKKTPTPLDERQMRQVAGGNGGTSLPRASW